MTMKELGMEIARDQAARVWAAPQLAGKEMDPEIAEEFARVVYAWVVGAKGAEMAVEYYRGILGQITERLGCLEEARFANLPAKISLLMEAYEDMGRDKITLMAAISKRNEAAQNPEGATP